ncbi:MAG: carbon-nitrogen hydrolase family protein [Thermoplasmata archaeon]|nr:carbon-nitrogen hydrolase family protein [Thermoplasmata archaeon]
MRLLLAELGPVRGELGANLARLEKVLGGQKAELAIFPELFLTGYRVGDQIHRMAVAPQDATVKRLDQAAATLGGAILVGGATTGPRPGEIHNAAILVGPDGSYQLQLKRYLPNYGPFEEGVPFSPGQGSAPLTVAGRRIGVGICYDTFFPELFRGLALAGAELLAIPSASPVTSRRLFEKLLPARAVENATPVAYVNRVGVEDGVVFGGGSGLWDARGEPLPLEELTLPSPGDGERLLLGEVDLDEAARWRPFRPVLRDVDRSAGTAPPPFN